jgi:hypothetical protein
MLTITNLPESAELDSRAMAAVSGGASLSSLGPFANVNVNIDQDLAQIQQIEVNALNNIGVLGADLGPLSFNLSPKQQGSLVASLSRGNPF